MPFNLGNAIKYLWRHGLKDGEPSLKELGKALDYVNREIALERAKIISVAHNRKFIVSILNNTAIEQLIEKEKQNVKD